ncbi:MAG: prepilin-type N-terminal cleavage/methylation domain-containing protein [Flavobacteriaceae bacterium]
MRRRYKIKAYTLSEMLVVLVLVTLVVGMAFSVLQLVQRQMGGIASNFERNTQFNLLQQSLWIDFNQNDGVWYDLINEQLVFSSGMGEQVYELRSKYIVKDRDTFQLKIEKKLFFLNGLEQASGEIDAIDLLFSKVDGSKQLFVFKSNAATTYINQ